MLITDLQPGGVLRAAFRLAAAPALPLDKSAIEIFVLFSIT
ncbi:hypothetical protein [Teichococcus wenyumeiae]|nr:hypothetical protein [Pseudoroseomonas wenyumeiae]